MFTYVDGYGKKRTITPLRVVRYGFIEARDGENDISIHLNTIVNERDRPVSMLEVNAAILAKFCNSIPPPNPSWPLDAASI